MSNGKIVLKRKEKSAKTDAIYVRLSEEQRGFLDSTAKKLKATRSETIRRFVEAIQESGVVIQ